MPVVCVEDGGREGRPEDRVHGGGEAQATQAPRICRVVVEVVVQAVAAHLGHYEYQAVRLSSVTTVLCQKHNVSSA